MSETISTMRALRRWSPTLLALLTTLAGGWMQGQEAGATPGVTAPASQRLPIPSRQITHAQGPVTPNLGDPGEAPLPGPTRFDLSFTGGTPGELVQAISKAAGFRLNAVIPDESANVQLPALEMEGVTAPQLFEALTRATMRNVSYASGFYSSGMRPEAVGRRVYQNFQVYSSFETMDKSPNDRTVWYFSSAQPPQDPDAALRTCRFFSLAPYLETFKVEDITTAVQTAWKMLGESAVPTLSYHEDTKLLIAVGAADQVRLIEDVLQQLQTETHKVGAAAPARLARPTESGPEQ